MKKLTILTILISFFVVNQCFALNLARVKTWGTEVLTAADLNAEFDNILDHSILNADIGASAAIVGSKLDLSVPGIIGGTTPAAGTFSTLTATGAIVANGDSITSDGVLVINATSETSFNDENISNVGDISLDSISADGASLTFAGETIADLGTVTTANIDNGTLDGVTIAGATATGSIWYNDASDNVATLTNGTAGNFLEANGAAAITWGNVNIEDYGTSTGTGTVKKLDGLQICYGTTTSVTSSGGTFVVTSLPFASSSSYSVFICRTTSSGSNEYDVVRNSGAQFTFTNRAGSAGTFMWYAVGT